MEGNLVVLFHGPDVFDKGYAAELVRMIPGASYYQAGTMGRTAAHDNGLDDIISIPDLPGKVVARSKGIRSLIIAICPRSKESGKSFVKIIKENSGISVPLMHIDFSSGSFVVWQGTFPEGIISNIKGLGIKEDSPLESIERFSQDGGSVTRNLRDCMVGDFVLCRNILIGRATDTDVAITVMGGRIVGTKGISIKKHGIEKLEKMGPLDINTAKCCATSNLRPGDVKPRVEDTMGRGVVFINHAGSEVYELSEGCEGAVVVGDDTSRIVGDILFRFNIPVIAITDGDRDGLIKQERFTQDSVLFEVDHDDEVGNHLFNKLFNKKERIDLPYEQVKSMVSSMISERVKDFRSF
ncbi:MAG TPA: DUF2117 domain-containing protein [Candidatus Methanofastidiosa archaeon]|nr:DUF2117 domain-containing protein [Candidatus Methanofastidiosa archaeon]